MAEWTYRCVECGDGKNLVGLEMIWMSGSIDPDGHVGEWVSGQDPHGVEENSIECSDHLEGEIQRRFDDGWASWVTCPDCPEPREGYRLYCGTCGGAGAIWHIQEEVND